jgi:hypothetical protein
MVLGTSFPEFNPDKFPLFVAELSCRKMITQFYIKRYFIFPDIKLNTYGASRFFVDVRPMNPMPAPPGNGAPGKSLGLYAYTASGYETGPAGKKGGLKEKCMDSRSLATIDTYRLSRKNARYIFHILHRHPWGG